ncbi:MAG: hypothetical protein U0572_06960 [Phycisphaerales bacterium]
MRAIAVVLVCLTLALVAAAARGQGAYDIAPDPIALAELRLGIASRVATPISEDDWLAIEQAHDAYLASMRELRDGSIAAALDALAPITANPWAHPDEMRDVLRRGDSIADRIAAADNALFDAVLVRLGEACQPAIQSLRDRRSATRSANTLRRIVWLNERVDLADPFWTATLLSPEERERIAPLIQAFEARQAALLRSVLDTALRRQLRIVEVSKAAPLDFNDREAWAINKTRWDRERAEHPEHEKAIEKLHEAQQQFRSSVLREVSFDARREIIARLDDRKDDFYQLRTPIVERWFRAALRSRALSAETRAALREQYQRWAEADEKLLDAYRADPGKVDATGDTRFTRAQETNSARDECAAKAFTELRPLLPKELGERVAQLVFDTDPFDGHAPEDADPSGDAPLVRRVGSIGGSGQENIARYRMQWNLRPLEDALLTARLVDATPEERTTIAAIVADAKDAWIRDVAPLVTKASGLDSVPWQEDAQEDAVAESVRAKLEAHEATEKLDRATFDALAAALPATRAGALRLARLERMLETWADHESLMAANTAWEVELLPNVARVVRTTATDASGPAVGQVLDVEGDALVAAARDRRRDGFRLVAEAAMLMNRSMKAQSDQSPEGQKRFQEAIERERTAGEQLVDLRRRTSAEFRRVLGRMLDAAPEAERTEMRLAYEREAYPELFFDRRSFQPWFDRALTLPTLDDERRARLRAMADDWWRRRAAQLFAYVDLMHAKPAAKTPDPNGESNRRRARDFFERNELNTRAVIALRRALTAEERERIRGLDDYERLVARLSGRFWDD